MSKCIACKCDEIKPGKDNCLPLLDANEALVKGSAVEVSLADVCDLPELSADALYNVSCLLDNIIKQICWINQNLGDKIDPSMFASKDTENAVKKIIANLEGSGAWTGGLKGNFNPNRNIATGNINLFGGATDGQHFIRTNKGSTENDLAGGV